MEHLLKSLLPLILISSPILGQSQTFDPKSKSLMAVQIGKVKLVKGEAELTHYEAEPTKVTREMAILEKDILKTKAKSIVRVQMVDDTEITIGPNTTFNFKKFRFKNKNNRKSVYNLILGKSRSVFKRRAGPNDIKVEAKGVSMGIRGTEVLMNVTAGTKEKTTEVVIGHGSVEGDVQKNGSDKKDKITMNKGDYYTTANVPQRNPSSSEHVAKLTPNMIHKLRDMSSDISFGELIQKNKDKAFAKPKKSKKKSSKSDLQAKNKGESISLEDKLLIDSFKPNKRPWEEVIQDMQWPRPAGSTWDGPARAPASVKKQAPKCKYQITCIKKHKYKDPNSNQIVTLCEETRTFKVPANCTP